MWEVPSKYGVSFLKSECQVSAFFQKGLKKGTLSIKIAMKEEERFSVLWHAFRGKVQHTLTASKQ
jgi:hypothetical protein